MPIKSQKIVNIRFNVKYGAVVTILFLLLVLTQVVVAESSPQRRGLITSAACPFSCEDAGVPRDQCRERNSGALCEVEDLSQPAGHRSMIRVPAAELNAAASAKRAGINQTGSQSGSNSATTTGNSPGIPSDRRGLVTSSACPYNCAQAKLAADICREWSSGTKCYVEDFTQAPGHRSMIRVP